MISFSLKGTVSSRLVASEADIEEATARLDVIRRVDVASIRAFVDQHAHFMMGRVLDFGAGVFGSCRNPEPYRALIERHATEYCAFDSYGLNGWAVDSPEFLRYKEILTGSACFDNIVCTQVLHYLADGGAHQLGSLRRLIRPDGHLLLTYATNWDEVEDSDSVRITRAHMARLLRGNGFKPIVHEERAVVNLGNFNFPIGYGVVARAI